MQKGKESKSSKNSSNNSNSNKKNNSGLSRKEHVVFGVLFGLFVASVCLNIVSLMLGVTGTVIN